MRRKAPRIGDLVKIRCSLRQGWLSKRIHPGIVTECVGIHLWVRLFAIPWDGHSGREYVRRDSVDVIARADHA